jgi:hypothetical protein
MVYLPFQMMTRTSNLQRLIREVILYYGEFGYGVLQYHFIHIIVSNQTAKYLLKSQSKQINVRFHYQVVIWSLATTA